MMIAVVVLLALCLLAQLGTLYFLRPRPAPVPGAPPPAPEPLPKQPEAPPDVLRVVLREAIEDQLHHEAGHHAKYTADQRELAVCQEVVWRLHALGRAPPDRLDDLVRGAL